MKISEHLTYISLRIFSFIVGHLPRKITIKFGILLGMIIESTLKTRYDVALKNISIAYPDLPINKQKQLLIKTYRHFGIVLMDFFRLPYLNNNNINNIIKFEDDSLELLKKYSKGIVMTAHYGNWEMILPSFNLNNVHLTTITQEQKNKGANKFFTWTRNKTNSDIILKNKSIRKMFPILEKGFLGLASDQYAGKKGTKVRFFGKETYSPKGAALFYIKSKSPIVIGFCKLMPDYSYSLKFKKMNIVNHTDNVDKLSENINNQFCLIVENIINTNPEQYFWFHRKWR